MSRKQNQTNVTRVPGRSYGGQFRDLFHKRIKYDRLWLGCVTCPLGPSQHPLYSGKIELSAEIVHTTRRSSATRAVKPNNPGQCLQCPKPTLNKATRGQTTKDRGRRVKLTHDMPWEASVAA